MRSKGIKESKPRKKGAGRKGKYGEKTVTVSYRIPGSVKEDADRLINDLIAGYVKRLKENSGTDNQ